MKRHEVDTFINKLDKNFAKFLRKHSHCLPQELEGVGGAEGCGLTEQGNLEGDEVTSLDAPLQDLRLSD